MSEQKVNLTQEQITAVTQPINGNPAGKHFLSFNQLSRDDVYMYLEHTEAADRLRDTSKFGFINLLPGAVLKAVMRQPSTRTAGSIFTAMQKLGGSAQVISGMESSSEAKGESLEDSWLAFATQSDMLGGRTDQAYGTHLAAHSAEKSHGFGKLRNVPPVINLGDGKHRHPTQTMLDAYTMRQHFGKLEGLTIAMVGDHERYRAFGSFLIAAYTLGFNIITVESPVAPVPKKWTDLFGDRLERTCDLDYAMRNCNVLQMGRNPDEYTGDDPEEQERSRILKDSYAGWIVDYQRLQIMNPKSIGMHPWPRNDELNSSVDSDLRMRDVRQMENGIPTRMAIIALHFGESLVNPINKQTVFPMSKT